MTLYLLDTDHLTLVEMGHARVLKKIVSHATDPIAICVISVLEQLEGWQRALHQAKQDAKREQIYRQMARTVESLSSWPVLAYTIPAMAQRRTFLRMRLNVGSNDLKIAAIAMEHNATVVTRNVRDFSRVPGVSHIDWSK